MADAAAPPTPPVERKKIDTMAVLSKAAKRAGQGGW